MKSAKTLIDWVDAQAGLSLLGAQVILLVCLVAAQISSAETLLNAWMAISFNT